MRRHGSAGWCAPQPRSPSSNRWRTPRNCWTVQYAVIFGRIVRFALTGNRVHNYGTHTPSLQQEGMRRCLAYRWVGNIRHS